MHYSPVSSSDVMGDAEAAKLEQQAALKRAAHEAAVALWTVNESLRKSTLDMITRRQSCIESVLSTLNVILCPVPQQLISSSRLVAADISWGGAVTLLAQA
jgi:hypothetical protein